MASKYPNFNQTVKKNPSWDPSGYNYQSYSSFSTTPPDFKNPNKAFYDDRGQGVPQIDENNMTIQDIYRTPFLFTNEHHKNYNATAITALKGIQSDSDLSKLFFSDDNIKRIQKGIKKAVYERTGGQFKLDVDQDERDIFIAMRAVYMENARFLPGQIVRQVKRLNEKTIDELLPGIITNIRQYYGYLKDINSPIKPIARPMNVNNRGRNLLPSITTSFGI